MSKSENDVDYLKSYIDAITKNSMNDVTKPKEIDLVISGGAFNSGYGYGALLYLRSLEDSNKIKVNRISGCSIGSLLAVDHLSNRSLNLVELYTSLQMCLRENGTLYGLRDIVEKIVDNALEDKDFFKKAKDRLFITRTDMSNGNHEVIDKFDTRDDLIDAIFSSCYIPFFVDGRCRYKEKYIDGLAPYLFTDSERPSLYIDLICMSKFHKMFVTMKEVNPHSRIIDGANDASKFFNDNGCGICSWTNKWGLGQILAFRMTHLILYIFASVVDILSNSSIPSVISDSALYKGVMNTLTRLLRDMLFKISSHDA
jgi:hypothetical protein